MLLPPLTPLLVLLLGAGECQEPGAGWPGVVSPVCPTGLQVGTVHLAGGLGGVRWPGELGQYQDSITLPPQPWLLPWHQDPPRRR